MYLILLFVQVWQCHGRMVDAPCSRVGHIYRCKYMPFKNAGVGDFISRNYRRVAEVCYLLTLLLFIKGMDG